MKKPSEIVSLAEIKVIYGQANKPQPEMVRFKVFCSKMNIQKKELHSFFFFELIKAILRMILK